MDTTGVLNGYTAPALAGIAAGDGRGEWTVTRTNTDGPWLRAVTLERGEASLLVATAGARAEVLAQSGDGQAEIIALKGNGETTPPLSELEQRWLDPSEGPAFESACLVVEALAWGAATV